MNRTFFLTHFAIWAALVAGGFVAWLVVAGYATGRGDGSDRAYLLWSGWIALALFLVVAAYSVRKYMHRMGISPEFRMRVTQERVEAAEARINDLRRQIATGAITSRKDAAARARAVLVGEGVHKVLRAEVDEEPGGLEIALHPTEPYGRMNKWMHAHLYLGIAAGVLVWVHGGANFATPMGFLLNFLSLVVVVTGLYGIVVWALGATWMTSREHDLTIEEAFVLEQSLARKARAALEGELAGAFEALDGPQWKDRYLAAARAGRGFDAGVREAISVLKRAALTDRNEAVEAKDKDAQKSSTARLEACSTLQDLMTLCGQHERVERTLAGLRRVKSAMNVWRAAHVPASVFLLGLLVVHVWSIWWY